MNKTIIINITGIVFHIEEDAYEILKNYMTDVKRHFLNSADSLEITTDIESRIAEMFTEILAKENKQVIIEQDVKLVIEQMGTVEDFEHAENDSQPAGYASHSFNYGTRTLFRDPDDHLVGGVCSGLANYFDIPAVWIRLAFALLAAFGGTGVILYIILWLVIPRAVSRADRMAMKGEKLNLQGFKNNLEEELSAVRQNLNNLHREARPFIYKIRDFISEFFHYLGKFFNGTGKILIKLIGVFILLSCLGGVIALIVAFCTVEIYGRPAEIFPFSVIANAYANKIYISAFFVAFIPVLTIALVTIKAIFNARTIDRSFGAVILVAWLFAIGVLVFYGSKISSGFRSSASLVQTINLKHSTGNTYYLKLNDIRYFTHEDSARLNMQSKFKNMIITNDNNYEDFEPDNLSITIERSNVNHPVLIESFRSKGSRYEDALFNARNTTYRFTQQDTLLTFDRRLQRLPGVSWYDQEIKLTLMIPLNSVLVVDEDINRYISNTIDINDCNENNKIERTSSVTMSAAFIMTASGLGCKIDTLVTTPPVIIDSAKTLKSNR